MKQLDEIFYDAIIANENLMTTIGGRVVSTCYEVPPMVEDNTQVPNIIIYDDGFQNQQTTKDHVWESPEDGVQATVSIAGRSPEEVKQLVKMVRMAIETHIVSMYNSGEAIPQLDNLSSDGISWDWQKPSYFQDLKYQCTIKADTEDEQGQG